MPEETTANVIDKGPYILEQNEFSGANQGFSFYATVYKNSSEEEAIASLQHAAGKYGATTLVGLINNSIKSAQRVKAIYELPKDEDSGIRKQKLEALRERDPILLSAEDADKFIPGIREVTIQSLFAKAAKASKEGNMVEASKFLIQAQELINKEMAAQSEAQS